MLSALELCKNKILHDVGEPRPLCLVVHQPMAPTSPYTGPWGSVQGRSPCSVGHERERAGSS